MIARLSWRIAVLTLIAAFHLTPEARADLSQCRLNCHRYARLYGLDCEGSSTCARDVRTYLDGCLADCMERFPANADGSRSSTDATRVDRPDGTSGGNAASSGDTEAPSAQ